MRSHRRPMWKHCDYYCHFILQPRCCWTTFVLLLLLFCPFSLSLLFFLWVKSREMFECVTAALRGRRGCFGGPLTFNLPCFPNGFSWKCEKKMGWREGMEKRNPSANSRPGNSRRGLDLKRCLTDNKSLHLWVFETERPPGRFSRQNGWSGTVDTLVIKWKS